MNLVEKNARILNYLIGSVGVVFVLVAVILGSSETHSQVLLSIGASMIASSIVVYLTSSYLVSQNRGNELTQEWGLEGIYSTRSEMNLEANIHLEKEKNKIDIIAFGLKSFRDNKDSVIREKVKQGVRIRIVTINPDSKFLIEREKNENEVNGQIRNTVLELIQYVQELQKEQQKAGQIEIKAYDSLPLDFYFGYEDIVFTGPYMYGKSSQQTISYAYRSNSKGHNYFSQYFEKIWNDNNYLRKL